MPAITPKEAFERTKVEIPDKVIEVWNALIVKNHSRTRNGYSTILQKEASKAISEAMNVSLDEVFENHWLDIEEVYRDAGWAVTYDRPGYNETYEAKFEFRVKKRED